MRGNHFHDRVISLRGGRFELIKLGKPRQNLMRCRYQDRKVSVRVRGTEFASFYEF